MSSHNSLTGGSIPLPLTYKNSRYGFLVAAILLFFFDFFNGTSQTYKNVKHVL
jgi:hypothetical protein